MGANDVQIRITAQDLASPAFQSMANSAQRATESTGSLSGLAQRAVFNVASVTAGILAYNGLADSIRTAKDMTFGFMQNMEQNNIGIAGILMSMTQVNGHNLQWNEAMNISQSIMKDLNSEALKMGSTTEELLTTYRALLGPGLAAKMTVQEIVKLSSTGVAAVKSLGLGPEQLVQELRDLVQGGIRPASSTLATALGLKDSDIERAKQSSEGLYNFLMKRLSGFQVAAEYQKGTWNGLVSMLKEGIQVTGAEGMGEGFEYAKSVLKDIVSSVVTIDETTKEIKINPEIVEDLKKWTKHGIDFTQGMIEAGKTVGGVLSPALKITGSLLETVADNSKAVGLGLAAWFGISKIRPIYSDIIGVTTANSVAQTRLGQAVQFVTTSYAAQMAMAQKTALAETANAERVALVQKASSMLTPAPNVVNTNRALSNMPLSYDIPVSNIKNMTENKALALSIENCRDKYIALGVSAEEAALIQTNAARAVIAGNRAEAATILATKNAEIAKASTSTVANTAVAASSTVSTGIVASNMVRATSAAKTFGKALLALSGGWVGVALACAYAVYELNEYWKNKNKVESYNPKAEVFKDENGNYTKKQIVKKEYIRLSEDLDVPADQVKSDFAKKTGTKHIKEVVEFVPLSENELKEQRKYEKMQSGDYSDLVADNDELSKQLGLKFDKPEEKLEKQKLKLQQEIHKLKGQGSYTDNYKNELLEQIYNIDQQEMESDKEFGIGKFAEQYEEMRNQLRRISEEKIRKEKDELTRNLFKMKHQGAYATAEDELAIQFDDYNYQEKDLSKKIGKDDAKAYYDQVRYEAARQYSEKIKKNTEDLERDIYKITHTSIEGQIADIEHKKAEAIRAGISEVEATRQAQAEKAKLLNDMDKEITSKSFKADPGNNDYEKKMFDLQMEYYDLAQKYGANDVRITRMYEQEKTKIAVEETKSRLSQVQDIISGQYSSLKETALKIIKSGGSGIELDSALSKALRKKQQDDSYEGQAQYAVQKYLGINPQAHDLSLDMEYRKRNKTFDGLNGFDSWGLVKGNQHYNFAEEIQNVTKNVTALAQRAIDRLTNMPAQKLDITVGFDENGMVHIVNKMADSVSNNLETSLRGA